MAIWKLAAGAVFGLLAAAIAPSSEAAEVLTLKANAGQLLHAGLYPSYYLFLKGVDGATVRTSWVDKPYKAVIEMTEGPEKGQSVVMELVPTTDTSPNPEWCETEGGAQFAGSGVTCKPGSAAKDQLRFRVRVLRSDDLPKVFAPRKVAEYPNLPGRRENEVLGPFEMQILLKE
jgi:hypothetical protein